MLKGIRKLGSDPKEVMQKKALKAIDESLQLKDVEVHITVSANKLRIDFTPVGFASQAFGPVFKALFDGSQANCFDGFARYSVPDWGVAWAVEVKKAPGTGKNDTGARFARLEFRFPKGALTPEEITTVLFTKTLLLEQSKAGATFGATVVSFDKMGVKDYGTLACGSVSVQKAVQIATNFVHYTKKLRAEKQPNLLSQSVDQAWLSLDTQSPQANHLGPVVFSGSAAAVEAKRFEPSAPPLPSNEDSSTWGNGPSVYPSVPQQHNGPTAPGYPSVPQYDGPTTRAPRP